MVLDKPLYLEKNAINNNSNGLTHEEAATRIQATFRGYIVRKLAKSDSDSVFLRDEKDEMSRISIQLAVEPATPTKESIQLAVEPATPKSMHSSVVTNAINNAVRVVEEEAKEKATKEETIAVTGPEESSKQDKGENVKQQLVEGSIEEDEVLWTSPVFATTVEDKDQETGDLKEQPEEHREQGIPNSRSGTPECLINEAHPINSSEEVEGTKKDLQYEHEGNNSELEDSTSRSNLEPIHNDQERGSSQTKKAVEDGTSKSELNSTEDEPTKGSMEESEAESTNLKDTPIDHTEVEPSKDTAENTTEGNTEDTSELHQESKTEL